MKYITFLLFFFPQLFFSQSIDELTEMRKGIEKNKNKLRSEMSKMTAKIDSIDRLIFLIKLRNRSVESIVKKEDYITDYPSRYTKKIEHVKSGETIHIIEYFAKGRCYKVLYKNEIGYIPIKSIKSSSALSRVRKLATHSNESSYKSSNYTSRSYIRGSRGGCYYINSNGNKTYVSRGLCN